MTHKRGYYLRSKLQIHVQELLFRGVKRYSHAREGVTIYGTQVDHFKYGSTFFAISATGTQSKGDLNVSSCITTLAPVPIPPVNVIVT